MVGLYFSHARLHKILPGVSPAQKVEADVASTIPTLGTFTKPDLMNFGSAPTMFLEPLPEFVTTN